MLKRTLFMAAVMTMPMVAEAQRGGRPGPGGPGGRPGPIVTPDPGLGGHQLARAIRISTRIGQAADSLARDARQIKETATARGHYIRAQRFEALRSAARELAMYYNRTVLPTLNSRAPEFRVKDVIRSSRPFFVNLDSAVSVIEMMPYDVMNLVKDIKEDQELLRSVMFGDGGVVTPPRGQWAGTCEVVLETLWGTNIKSFYGTSFAPTQAMATQQAKINGIQQCNANLGGWLKCTVSGNCGATIVRR